MSRVTRREFLRLSTIASAGLALAACTAPAAPPQVPAAPTQAPAPAQPQQATKALEPTKAAAPTIAPAPTVAAPKGKYQESPMLAELVKAGKLPSVDQRLPTEPRIVPTLEGIGKYSDVMHMASVGSGSGDLSYILMPGMFGETNDGKMFANFAKEVKPSPDFRSFTFVLRPGLKWSDGEPFTTADVKFWYEDDFLNTEINPIPPQFGWTPGGDIPKLDIVDDNTFTMTWKNPNRPLMNTLMFWAGMWWNFASGTPAHYMKKFHIKYNPGVADEAKAEGYTSWFQYYGARKSPTNSKYGTQKPVVCPWLMKQYTQTQSVYERNPYFWGVDSAGNQLPYFDQIVVETLQDKETYNLRIVAGQLDYASTWTSLNNLPLYVDNAQKGGYNVYKYKSPRGSDESFTFNRNSKDPVLAKIFQDPRWSQAISYGTNRKEVQDVVFLGTGVIRQAAPNPDVSYFKKEWEDFCVEYNVDKANQLLDDMGLKKGTDGIRLRPDGQPLSILIELTDQTDSPTLDVTKVVVQHWEKLGLKVTYKVDDRQLLETRGNANEIDAGVWHTDRTNEARAFVPNVAKLLGDAIDYSQPTNIEWYRWWQSQGKQGEEPPEDWKAYFKNVDDWHACTNDADYKRLAQEIFDFVILKQLRVIGTVGFTTWPIIVKNTMGNVPSEGFMGDDVGGSRSLVPEAWFRKA